LVKKIDDATAKHQDAKMGSFVVFVGGGKDFDKNLKALAAREHIDHTILATFEDSAGPAKYKLAKDADVTVLLYSHKKVKANYAFGKGEMKDADVEHIIGDLSRVLSESKEKAPEKVPEKK
jgi:hypothetical protein